jgi:hypothetical protein
MRSNVKYGAQKSKHNSQMWSIGHTIGHTVVCLQIDKCEKNTKDLKWQWLGGPFFVFPIFDCALLFFEVWSFAIPKFGTGEVDLY